MITSLIFWLCLTAGDLSPNGQVFPQKPPHCNCIGLTSAAVEALLNEKPVATIVTGAIDDPLVLYFYGNSRIVVRYRAGIAVDAFRAK